MGKIYVQKTSRAGFSQNTLAEAMNKVNSREMGVNEASREYGISSSKYLKELHPLPLISNAGVSKRKQSALELTSPENRIKCRVFSEKNKANTSKKAEKNKSCPNQGIAQTVTNKKKGVVKKARRQLSSSFVEKSGDFCIECREYYYTTKSKVDWIRCTMCSSWLHETCTSNKTICNKCAKENKQN